MGSYLQTDYDLADAQIISVIDDLPLWSAPFGLKMLEVVNYRQGMKVLDIGSGCGFPIIELAQRLGDSCLVYGVDPWRQAVDRIFLKAKVWGIKNIHLTVAKAESLQFENNFFELIVSNNGINNVEDEKLVFAEIGRVAKKGAQLILTANLPETMKEFYQILEVVLVRQGKTEEVEKLKEHIFAKRKPLSYTRKLIEQAGFRLNKIYKHSFDLKYTDGTSLLNHFLIKLAFLPSWKAMLQVKDQPSIFGEVEKELNNLAQQNGCLKLTIPWVCFDARKSVD